MPPPPGASDLRSVSWSGRQYRAAETGWAPTPDRCAPDRRSRGRCRPARGGQGADRQGRPARIQVPDRPAEAAHVNAATRRRRCPRGRRAGASAAVPGRGPERLHRRPKRGGHIAVRCPLQRGGPGERRGRSVQRNFALRRATSLDFRAFLPVSDPEQQRAILFTCPGPDRCGRSPAQGQIDPVARWRQPPMLRDARIRQRRVLIPAEREHRLVHVFRIEDL